MPGELKKLKIKAKDKSGKELVYTALVNPETYVIKQKVNYNPAPPPQGNPGKNQQYNYTAPPDIQFDFIFDSTGVVPKPLDGIAEYPLRVPLRRHYQTSPNMIFLPRLNHLKTSYSPTTVIYMNQEKFSFCGERFPS